MATAITVGDTYQSKPTDFLIHNHIPEGIDFVITNIDGDKVSLFLKYAHGKQCPSKITITKSRFGANFSQDPYAPINTTYAQAEHYFPDVNEECAPLMPSTRYAKTR